MIVSWGHQKLCLKFDSTRNFHHQIIIIIIIVIIIINIL